MTSSEYGEHFEKWSAELAGDVPTTTATDPDEAPVPVDSPEAQRERPRVRDGERRPVVPAWAKSKAGIAAEVKRVVSLGLHVVEYHALRVPVYAARLTLRAPRGVKLWWRELADWVNDAEGRPLRAATAAREDYEAYRKLVLIRDRHVRWRGMVVTASAAAVAIAGSVLYATGQMAEPPAWSETARSWPVWLAAAAAGLAAAGWKGRPEDKPLLEAAVVKTSLAPLTSDVVIRGLSVLGISGISQALAKDPNAIGFVSPIARDGNGWRAEVDLPYGVTVGEVADRRDKLASGLGRPLGCVWPEGNADVHPGRLVVWVGDEDMARAKQPAWPLLRKGKVNLFEAFELGTDPRGRTVWLTLMFASMVIGAIPRMGKTFALRLILLACALDPRCELHVFNLKGGSDFAPLQPVSHAWRTGDRDDDIEYLVADLRKLHADMQRRYQVIEELPRELCPESKVTDELASKKSLGLHPVVVALDECQRGFEHKEHGVEIEEICEDLVRRGPAVGIMAICATQRPDKDSLPKGISANAALRFCLKVTGQVENDMVLGTSAYKNGVRATMFSRRDRGIGYLTGEADDAQITRTHFVDGPGAEAVAARARAMREAEGRVTGYAGGQADATPVKPVFDLLKDLVAVFPAKEKTAWNSHLVDLLVELRPDFYGQRWNDLDEADKTSALTGALKEVKAEQIVVSVGRRIDGKSVTRRGVNRDTLQEIITLRDGKPGGG